MTNIFQSKIKKLSKRKDYLTNHFTLECNNCGKRNDVLINLDEDFFKEMEFTCFKCLNTFTINLKGYELGKQEYKEQVEKVLEDLENRNLTNGERYIKLKQALSGEVK